MSAQKKIDLANRYAEEVWNRGNIDQIDKLLAEDYQHGSPPPGMSPDREGFKQFASMAHSAFPDYQLEVEDTLAQGDKVVQRWTVHATHEGEFMGVPPTGNDVTFTGTSIYQIEDGKIVKDWTRADMMGLMRQIGAVPERA